MVRLSRVVIGEQPARGQSNSHPLYPYNRNSAAHRLIHMCDVPVAYFERNVAKFNLCPFDADEEEFWEFGSAKLARSMMSGRLLDGCSVLLLGEKVKAAFSIETSAKCGRVVLGSYPIRFYFIPHPSGLNRFYNDPANVLDAKIVLDEWLFR